MKNTAKLDQLTSLRFFAALLIVLQHSDGRFGFRPSWINASQGVSFFYVLSGFILAYVYPHLDSGAEVGRFWRARFARIWPAYVLSFLLALYYVPFPKTWHTALAHLAMVQSWIPMSAFYFSYDAAAWSVSTEAFFYLVFPLLILNWRKTWAMKLAVVASIAASLIAASALFPGYGDPYAGQGYIATVHGLVYINPLSRLPEFAIGVALAFVWKQRWVPSGTLAELAVLALAALSMHYITPFAQGFYASHLGLGIWLNECGSVLAFAAVICVFARGNGIFSKALRARPLVLLGEISFSMYLLHQTMFGVLAALEKALPPYPFAVLYIVFTLGVCYCVWRFVEVPARRWLVGAGRGRLPPVAATA